MGNLIKKLKLKNEVEKIFAKIPSTGYYIGILKKKW